MLATPSNPSSLSSSDLNISFQTFRPQFILKKPLLQIRFYCSPNTHALSSPISLALTLLLFSSAFSRLFRKANLLPSLASCWTELWIFYFYSPTSSNFIFLFSCYLFYAFQRLPLVPDHVEQASSSSSLMIYILL